jgi:Clp protease
VRPFLQPFILRARFLASVTMQHAHSTVHPPGRSDAGSAMREWGWLIAALPLALLGGLSDFASEQAQSLQLSAACQLAGRSLMLLSLICCAVGLWKAAARFERRHHRLSTRFALQLAAVGLGIALAGGVVLRQLGEEAWEMARIALGHDPVAPVQIRLDARGEAMWLYGTLGAGSADLFRQALQAAPGLRVIHLESAGGRVFEAQGIADEIRHRRLDTYADGLCASACTMLLLAGRDRGAADQARIGFHRPQFAGIDDERVTDAHALLVAYRQAGLGAAFLARVRATRSDSMWYPSRSELRGLRVLTR